MQTEVIGVALVRAITGVVGAGEILFVDVFAGDVIDRRVVGFVEDQYVGRGRDLDAVEFHYQAAGKLFEGNDGTRAGAFHGVLLDTAKRPVQV
ncbi:hypothetical protein D3C81_1973910 [compost metagenome]